MTGFTKGPWQSDGSVGVYRAGDTNDISNLVALVYSSDLKMNLADNARLVSAAPDMYEALKALWTQAVQSNVSDPANKWGEEALSLARAALAKAEGRE